MSMMKVCVMTRPPETTLPYPKHLSVAEVADCMGVVPLTVKRLIKARKLPASKFARRVVIRPSDLDAYLAAHPAGGQAVQS
jgi:excisionase family DNA binding protein